MPPIHSNYPYPRQGHLMSFPKQNDKIYIFDDDMIEQIINNIISKEERKEIESAIFLPLTDLVKPGAKKNKNNKPPRSQNIFLLFRKDQQARLTFEKGPSFTSELKSVSTFASRLWKRAPAEQRSLYDRIAFLTKKVHKHLWPDYSYKPSRQKISCSPFLPLLPSPSHLDPLQQNHYLFPPPPQKPYLPPPLPPPLPSKPYLPPPPLLSSKPYLPSPLSQPKSYFPPPLPPKPFLPPPLPPPSSHVISYLPSPTLSSNSNFMSSSSYHRNQVHLPPIRQLK